MPTCNTANRRSGARRNALAAAGYSPCFRAPIPQMISKNNASACFFLPTLFHWLCRSVCVRTQSGAASVTEPHRFCYSARISHEEQTPSPTLCPDSLAEPRRGTNMPHASRCPLATSYRGRASRVGKIHLQRPPPLIETPRGRRALPPTPPHSALQPRAGPRCRHEHKLVTSLARKSCPRLILRTLQTLARPDHIPRPATSV